MDLLFTRYASPFVLLDGLIISGSFSLFIDDFIDFVSEKVQWDFFLHKIFDKSWDEFRSENETPDDNNEIDLGATLMKSKNMLNNFTPE